MQYAQEGLAKHWFGDSDGAAIVKERDGSGKDVYSVYGTKMGSFTKTVLGENPHLGLGNNAEANFKVMKPHPDLTALVTKEGLIAAYLGNRVVTAHGAVLDEGKKAPPAGPHSGSTDKPWTSRTLDVMEGVASKTMPKGSQFSWAMTWQVQGGSKALQSKIQQLGVAAFRLGLKAPGAWKAAAVPAGGAGWLLGQAFPSDVEVRVDADGRKSNIMFLDTDVHGGTVRFGFVNNMTGGFGGKTPQATAAIVTLDAAMKGADYQGTSAYALMLHALYNGLSTEMNVEVSFAQPKDQSAAGQKGNAKGPLVPDDGTKVWLSFSFVAVSEGGQSSKTPGWQPWKNKVSAVVQVPIDAKKIDPRTLAKLTSGSATEKAEAAAEIALANVGSIPFASAFKAALIASGLRTGERIEDLVGPGMMASINTEYSTSRKLLPENVPGLPEKQSEWLKNSWLSKAQRSPWVPKLSVSPLIETKITMGMTKEGKEGERRKFLGIKITYGQVSADNKFRLANAKVAFRPSFQVNIPLPIDKTGRTSAQGVSQILDDAMAKMKTAKATPGAQPHTVMLEVLRERVLNSRTETGHWTPEERRAVEEKWRQAMELARRLEH